jgi:PAS domain S-box-containing protein
MFELKKRKEGPAPPDFGVFTDFLDAVGAAVVVLSTDRKVMHMNSAARRLWGDGVGHDCFRTLRQSREICEDCPFDEVLKSRNWLKRETRMYTSAGWRTHENLYLFTRGRDPRVGLVALVSSDVEDTRTLQRAVLKEKELSRALLDSVNSVVLGFDENGELEFVNRATETTTGYTEAEIIKGGGIDMLVPPDSLEHARDYFSRPPDSPRRPEPALIPVRTSSGKERMISWTYSPLVVSAGETTGAVALGQDVTERYAHRREAEKRAEELEIVNTILARVGAATDFEEMLGIALDRLLTLPSYRSGAAYVLSSAGSEARLVAATGFSARGPDEYITGTERIFPATAVYNKRIEVAPGGARSHPLVERVRKEERLSGMVAIPLLPGGHPLGLLVLGYDGEPDDDGMGMEVLRASAEALELGAENAFLRVRAEQRAREATALFRVGQHLTGTLDISAALSEVARETVELLEADLCAVLLGDLETGTVKLSAGYAREPALKDVELAELSLADHKAGGEVARTLKPIAIFDTRKDSRVPGYVSSKYGIKSSLHVALSTEGKFVGTLYLAMTTRNRQFTTHEIDLMESFARQASIAIHNAALVGELRESEERYKAIMENSSVGMVVHDGEDVLYTNESAARITGYDSSYFKKATDLFNLSPPEERKKLLAYLERRMTGDALVPMNYDTHIHRRDGSEAILQLQHTPVTIGGHPSVLVAVYDVTDRAKAEEAVKASEEKYRTLVESSRDAIIIANPDGIALFANSACVALTGRKMSDIIGTSVYEVVHPDEKSATLAKFKREWEAGRAISRYPVRSVVHGQERFFEVTTAIMGEAGPEANVMLIVSDVTGRVTAQRQVEASEEKYRTIVETTHDAILSVNRAGEVIYANKAVEPMFGVSPEDSLGWNILRFVHPDDREAASSELASDFKAGTAGSSYELRCLKEDGSVIHVELNAGLVGWPGEDALEILVVRDVTERRLAERERERHLKGEEALSSITAMFVDPGDLFEAIQRTLAELSTFLGGSRSFFLEIGADGKTVTRSLEWSPGSDTSFSERLLGVDTTNFTYMYPLLSSGSKVVVEDATDMGSEMAREFRKAFDVESIAAVPVFVGGAFKGIIGYSSSGKKCSWSQGDVDLLTEVGDTVSRAMERREFVEELARSEQFRARITESIGEGLAVLSNGTITWANPQLSELSGYTLEELSGKTTEVLMPEPGLFSGIVGDLMESLVDTGVFSKEDKLRRKDGKMIDVDFYVTALGVGENGAAELLVAVKDVTAEKKMREEVEAAAEAYSTLFSSAGDALFVHDKEGRMLDANERAAAYTGYTREQLVGMNVLDLIPERLKQYYGDIMSRIDRERSSTFETRIRRADGTVLPAEATSRVTRIWGEKVILSALRDISERKRAEKETARRAAQLASLNEIVTASTSSLELETVAAEILRVTIEVSGAEAGMIVLSSPLGKPTMVTAAGEHGGRFHPPTDKLHLGELLSWASGEGSSTMMVDLDGETPGVEQFTFLGILKKGGMAQALFIPLYSGDKSIGVIAMGSSEGRFADDQDLGFYNAAGAEIGVSIENALIYKELAAEHERLSMLYRSAQSISGELELQALLDTTAAEAARTVGAKMALLALVDADGGEFVWSSGYNIDLALLESLSLPTDEAIGGAVVASKRSVTIPRESARSPQEAELIETDPVIRATGMDFRIAVPLISGDRVLGVMGLGEMDHEITREDVLLLEAIGRQSGVAIQNARLYEETRMHLEALEKAHQELMVLDRMKSDFVSTVSHELRSPLAVIEGFARTLTEHFDRIDRETQMESIEIILKKSIALEGLIENILDMSRIEEGRLDVSREPFDIVEVCRLVSEDQEEVAELHELIIDCDQEELVVVADREKTEVALGNLLRNALKFSPEGGAVRVSVKQTDGVAEVSVTDEGIGIAPEQYERVFDRFYQIDSSETRSFPGSGLGLYIAKELVQSMGGEIKLSSELGAGSTFTFTLPLAR